jgi:hypothetical protein
MLKVPVIRGAGVAESASWAATLKLDRPVGMAKTITMSSTM